MQMRVVLKVITPHHQFIAHRQTQLQTTVMDIVEIIGGVETQLYHHQAGQVHISSKGFKKMEVNYQGLGESKEWVMMNTHRKNEFHIFNIYAGTSRRYRSLI